MIEIPAEVVTKIKSFPIPLIIGVSGLGGAGKSSFAHALGRVISAPVIGVDSFQKNRTDQEYSMWEIMDYERLEREVIKPFLAGEPLLRYGHFDWDTNGIELTKEVSHQGVIIIEGVGLFRPELNNCFGYKVWVDCQAEEATARGKKRDREQYQNPQDESWDGVWKTNDQECVIDYKPKEVADLIFDNG
jgi:uridine kinase